MLKKIFGIAVFLFIARPALGLDRPNQEKIYFAKMKLERVVPIIFPDLEKTFYFLDFRVVGDSKRTQPLLTNDIVVERPEDSCKNFYFVHSKNETILDPIFTKQIGEIVERAVRADQQNCAEKADMYMPPVDDDAVKIASTPLVRAQFPFVWPHTTPAPESIPERLKKIEAVLHFFGATSENGYLRNGKNAYTDGVIKSLGVMKDQRAFDFALNRNILNQAWFGNSAWDRLPQIDDYLISLYPEKLAFYEIIEKLWDINPDKARPFVHLALEKMPQLKTSTLSSLIDRLPYREFIDFTLKNYKTWAEKDKILFLHFAFTTPYGHDEIFKDFLTEELQNVKSQYTEFGNSFSRESTEKIISDYLAVLAERHKKKLYEADTLSKFLYDKRYQTEGINLVRGMRFVESGSLFGYGTVVVKKNGTSMYFEFEPKPEIQKKLAELKPGNPVIFEGTLKNFGSYSLEDKSVSIDLEHVKISNPRP